MIIEFGDQIVDIVKPEWDLVRISVDVNCLVLGSDIVKNVFATELFNITVKMIYISLYKLCSSEPIEDYLLLIVSATDM